MRVRHPTFQTRLTAPLGASEGLKQRLRVDIPEMCSTSPPASPKGLERHGVAWTVWALNPVP